MLDSQFVFTYALSRRRPFRRLGLWPCCIRSRHFLRVSLFPLFPVSWRNQRSDTVILDFNSRRTVPLGPRTSARGGVTQFVLSFVRPLYQRLTCICRCSPREPMLMEHLSMPLLPAQHSGMSLHISLSDSYSDTCFNRPSSW